MKLIIEGSAQDTGTANRAKGAVRKGNIKGEPRGYSGEMSGVSGERKSGSIITVFLGIVKWYLIGRKWLDLM